MANWRVHACTAKRRYTPNHTVYGTGAVETTFPGASCQDFGELSRVATFIRSLRDQNLEHDDEDEHSLPDEASLSLDEGAKSGGRF